MNLTISTKKFECSARTPDEAKRQLVLATRIFANEGHFDAFGHVSIRNPENPNTFFQSHSLSPEFVTMDDILEIDLDGNVVQGIEGKKPYGERVLHCRVLAARSDVDAVFHGHPPALIPFTCCRDLTLQPVHVYGSLQYKGIGFYDDADVTSASLVVTIAEGDRLARALGDKYTCLMRGHGITTAAENLPILVYNTVLLVWNAQVQLDILKAGGTPKCFSEEEGRAYATIAYGDNVLNRAWDYYVARAKKAMPDIADL